MKGHRRSYIFISNFLFLLLSIATITVSPFFPPAVDSHQDASSSMSPSPAGELEKLKQEEAKLSSLLAQVRQQKLSVLRSRPLTIGIIGFGRFGQFIGKSFAKYGNVIGTSRSDYTEIAREMGVKYMPLSDLEAFVMEDELDVIVIAVSIVSFQDTVQDLVLHLQKRIQEKGSCPLIVDVLSVKEHARNILLELLPEECDILCTHPMFGPDSAKHGWQGQTFVYERTRIDGVLLDPTKGYEYDSDNGDLLMDEQGLSHDAHENSDAHIEGMDRIERFLSIWEEEGCNMISMSCKSHDGFTANSQFITHLMGRILGAQGLQATPIDTKGFQSVLKLIETTNADSFDLFFGLYKFNRNSKEAISRLKESMNDVVGKLLEMEGEREEHIKSCL
ncbi:hypothetical protein HJC23_003331 [Cyclotella cryptica]|uniref:Prephenate/arogenate dehydrogenase domain-containing protein n=1 Tax=Cyclotella cryptica TaxID=29204 RepID=A0ABD3QY11_9STRA|eukprot:CCRYP_000892-RC/>CCRYP_000892-RC protein AED:0.16 eAED:0.16 QI:385/1/1/1/1/1/3/82/389